jgi:hypothetical protein
MTVDPQEGSYKKPKTKPPNVFCLSFFHIKMSEGLIRVKALNSAFFCGCGWDTWDLPSVPSWRPKVSIAEATFLHVRCSVCDKSNGLLGTPGKDWVVFNVRK